MNTPASLPIANPKARTWSHYQTDLFDAMVHRPGHLLVQALAGSGKSTSMIEGVNRWRAANPTGRAAMCAFNKTIAEELKTKVAPGVVACTLHSAGFRAVKRRFPKVQLFDRKLPNYAEELALQISDNAKMKQEVTNDLVQAYSLLKNTGTDMSDLIIGLAVLDDYAVEPKHPQAMEMLATLDEQMLRDTSRINFDEMLTFVIDHNCPMDKYDLVCVDEAQDLNAVQIELLSRMLAPGGRIVACGDRFQACYLFRGATNNAMDSIADEFGILPEDRLPLNICYRCPKSVIRAAQQIVDQIEHAPNATEGSVTTANPKALEATLMNLDDGDMVICRCNGPLVSCALKLIKNGRKAIVRGRDIGRGLAKLAQSLRHDGTILGLIDAARAWGDREAQRLIAQKKDAQAQNAQDRAETLIALTEGLNDVSEIEGRIAGIFSDDMIGVVFSSIHRSKGLEATNVVWINPGISDFFYNRAVKNGNHAQAAQEINLKYIAITRAQESLTYQPLPKDGEG